MWLGASRAPDTHTREKLPLQFYVETVTPFDARGRVDLGRLREHVRWLTAHGIDGFVPTATTGEFLYLADREREAVHRTVLDAARGCPVYPFVWDPSPATTQYLTDAAREQGASGVVLPPPLYHALPEEHVETWYRQMRDTMGLPLLAWHDPTHLPTPISEALYVRLRQDEVVVGMIDHSGDRRRLRRLAALDPGAVLAGDDALLTVARRLRTGGFVSTLANAWPALCLRLYREGETSPDEGFRDRVAMVRRAGGLRALKSLLGMHCRSPLPAPTPDEMEGLPPAEAP